MRKIVFATCNKAPKLQPSDEVLAAALNARGAFVIAAPWNGPFAPFDAADLVVVRSTWDYANEPEQFAGWLTALRGVRRAVNAPALMAWNMRKTYLLELAAKGAALPATRLADPTPAALAEAMENLGLEEAVVKPIIGATASGISIVRRDDPAGIERAAAALGHPALVQPLIAEIATRGETSMMFFGGAFSHAVAKRPKAGSILVQSEFGGVAEAAFPPEWAIAEGRGLLSLAPATPHYARVDVVILDESLLVMEVELIEPELFFTHDRTGADRLAAVLMQEPEV